MKQNKQISETAEVVDIHCHAAGIGAGRSGCYVSPRLRNNWRYRLYLRAFGVTETEICESGDGLVIQRLSEQLAASKFADSAVLLALDCCVDRDGHENYARTEMYVPNEFVMRETFRYPNLYFGASIHPYRNDAISRLHNAVAQGAVLMKWLPSVQHIDPGDRRLISFYKSLRDLGLPLLVHTGNEHSFTASHNPYSAPVRLSLPLDCGVTVIAAHMATNGMNGGEKNFDRLLTLFLRYPHLFGEISSLTQLNKIGHLKKVLAHRALFGRLLYGTDMPILNTAVVSPFYFMQSLGLRKAIAINQFRNSWDRDIKLKEALGVPHQVFVNGSTVLKLNSRKGRQ